MATAPNPDAPAFSPGPWTYVRNPENTRWIIDSAPGRAIACTAGAEPDNEANARLMTASPDLYAMLAALVDQPLRCVGPNIEIPCGSHVAAIQQLREARAALLKAKGA